MGFKRDEATKLADENWGISTTAVEKEGMGSSTREVHVVHTPEHRHGRRMGWLSVAVSCVTARAQNMKGHGEGRTTCSN